MQLWKKHFIVAAKELKYQESVIEKLKEAETEDKCLIIMANARKGIYPRLK